MSKVSLSLGKKNRRSCDGCTKCCEGWLAADILGNPMYPGCSCKFVEEGKGCTIYKDRPKDPCKTFECMWRGTDAVPIEFKPSEVNSIISNQEIEGIKFLALIEAGEKMRAEVVAWFIMFVTGRQLNAEWEIDGKRTAVGHPDFIQAIERRNKNER